MPQPTITQLLTGSIRRRSRTYDVGVAARKLADVVDFIMSPYVLSVDVGDLKPTIRTTPPDGWLMLDGSTFDAGTYPELAAALGGNTLPDFRDRFPIGAGGAVGLFGTGGAASTTLSIAQIPSHTHGITDPGHTHGITDPGHDHAALEASALGSGGLPGGTAGGRTSTEATGISIDRATTGLSVDATGGGQPVDILPPFVGINWMIKT